MGLKGQEGRFTRAANVNSKSSERNVLSLMATLMTSSSSWGFRKRYSVTPSQSRKSYQASVTRHVCFGRSWIEGGRLTGVEHII